MKGISGDYPLRRQLAAEGLTLTEAAALLGLSKGALSRWAARHRVRFADGRPALARMLAARRTPEFEANRIEALRNSLASGAGRRTPAPAMRRTRPATPSVPLSSAWLASRLTEGELADFRLLRRSGGHSGLEALASIRRPDLVAEVEAHHHAKRTDI